MDITIKKLPRSKAEIAVALSWEEWKGEIETAVGHLSQHVKMPGFRPGHTPRAVIEKRFGKQGILNEAAEHAVRRSYQKALARENLEALGAPEVKLEKLAEHEMLKYVAITAVMPSILLTEWRSVVKQINAEFANKKEVVEDKEIDAEIEKLTSMRAKLVTVNREARLGDSVLIDFSVLRDGVPIENGKGNKHPLVLGSGVFIPGFEDNLLNMRAGEEKSFELDFPEEYHDKHLAGKTAAFQVKINVVQERELPIINDEFVRGLGNFESLQKLKENMHEGILAEKKIKNKEEWRAKITEAFAEKSPIEYPDILVEEELKRMTRALEMQVKSMGLDFAEYLIQMKKTEDDLKKEWEPVAKKMLAANLILDTLAKEGEIDVDSQEVESEMNKTLSQYPNIQEIKKKIDMERLYNSARGKLLQDKTVSWLRSL